MFEQLFVIWFDEKCFKAREYYYKVRNKMKFVNPDTRQSKIKDASKRLKTLIKDTKKAYYKKLHNKLHNLQLSRIQYKDEEEEVVCDTDYSPGYI